MSKLKEQLQAALKGARDLSDAVTAAGREFTAEERTQVQGYLDQAKSLRASLVEQEGDAELRKAIAEMGEGVGLAERGERKEGTPAGAGKSRGEQFVTAPELKRWLEYIAPSGHVPETTKGIMSPPVLYKSLLSGADLASAGAFVVPDRDTTLVPLGRRPLVMRNLVTAGRTTSDMVEYVRVASETMAAAPVAEATGAGDGSGAKPESGMTLAKIQAPVKTIATWIPVTKRALSDVAQLRTIVDDFLTAAIEQALEDEMLTGDGTGEHFMGLLNVSGIQVQAFDTDVFRTTRIGRRKVKTVGRMTPNGYLLNPIDTENIDLQKDLQGRYYMGGPIGGSGGNAGGGGDMTLWRLPVIEADAITTNVGVVGDFRQAVLWDREQASIQVSDSHSDFFVRNLVALLVEMRAAFGVRKPSAFVRMALA